jgi:hypothetical protein
MSQQQSDKHGPAIDEALKDERHQESAGTRHADRPVGDPADADDVRGAERPPTEEDEA